MVSVYISLSLISNNQSFGNWYIHCTQLFSSMNPPDLMDCDNNIPESRLHFWSMRKDILYKSLWSSSSCLQELRCTRAQCCGHHFLEEDGEKRIRLFARPMKLTCSSSWPRHTAQPPQWSRRNLASRRRSPGF